MGIADILRIFTNRQTDSLSERLYNACVAASRQPAFYIELKVPDTLEGRFDLLVLHVALVMRGLTDNAARQRLFDHMFQAIERNLREKGIGDMGLGRKMRPLLESFYGRAHIYEECLKDSDNTALVAALARNLYGLAAGDAAGATRIATYVRDIAETMNPHDLAEGRLAFPAIEKE